MSYNRKTNMYEGYIYKCTNLINNKIYIGQTTRTIKQRWNEHIKFDTTKRYNTVFDCAINKYGKENFKVEELEKVYSDTKDTLVSILNDLEKFYIHEYNSLIDNRAGYNVDEGGQTNNYARVPVDVYNINGEFITTYKSKVEASECLNINVRIINSICYGEFPNYKCELVFRNSGEPFELYNVKSLCYKETYVWDLDGNFIDKFITRQKAIEFTGCTFISDVIDNPYRIGMGYWFSSIKEFNYKGMEKKVIKKIDLYDVFGNYIKTFDSIVKCANFLNLPSNANVIAVCKGKKLTINGCVCRYHGEPFDSFDYFKRMDSDLKCAYTKINAYDKNKIFQFSYQSIRQYSKDKNCKSSRIKECCDGKISTAYGYHWYYTNDPNQPDKTKIINNLQECG